MHGDRQGAVTIPIQLTEKDLSDVILFSEDYAVELDESRFNEFRRTPCLTTKLTELKNVEIDLILIKYQEFEDNLVW